MFFLYSYNHNDIYLFSVKTSLFSQMNTTWKLSSFLVRILILLKSRNSILIVIAVSRKKRKKVDNEGVK